MFRFFAIIKNGSQKGTKRNINRRPTIEPTNNKLKINLIGLTDGRESLRSIAYARTPYMI